ncbi:MAG: DUF3775 domain-containing protein [Alphaproteobacteria bacterium]|nr:DUF3775 domain-containing protein [Alphaproteobacteria bacterium]
MDALSLDKVEFIISIAREVGESSLAIIGDELADNNEPLQYSELSLAEQADNSSSENFDGDSAYLELKSVIDGMNEEERNELVALMWLGRGTYSRSEWKNAVIDARDASNNHTVDYMVRTPLLPDYLTEGLAMISED